MKEPAISVNFEEEKIDAIFAPVNQCYLPGAAVGIAIAGNPVYRKGFGLAHMELPIVLSPSMRMRIHSTSKHFTCLAYLLLCEGGRADVDDRIGKYFPELNPAARSATMRQLMGNVGGLRNPMNLHWEFSSREREIPIEELLDFHREIDDVNFEPGTAFNYNNSGFELVGAAIERITGQRLEDVLRSRIFEPVGMTNTLLRRFNSDFVPNSASMHMMNGAGKFEKAYLPGAVAGAGGIVSTVDDMLRWMKHMDAPTVGTVDTWTELRSSQVLANGSATGYGLGLWSGGYRGVKTLFHSGGGLGANSQMLKVPGARLDIAVMVNRSDVSAEELTERILDACLPGLEPVAQALDRAMPTGVFRSPTSKLVVQLSYAAGDSILGKKGQLLATINGADCPIAFDTLGLLRPIGPGAWSRYAFEIVDEPGESCALRFDDYGNVMTLEWVERVEKADGSGLVGRYVHTALDTKAEIFRSDGELRIKFSGRLGTAQHKLESLAEGIWASTQIDIYPRKAMLWFDQRTRAFEYGSYSTHNGPLRFERCS